MNGLEMQKTIELFIQNNLKLLITGKPGIGKTAIVEYVANRLGIKLLKLVPCSDESVDYKGIPCVINNKAMYLIGGQLLELIEAKEKMICFIDEIGQADDGIQKALMKLIYGGLIGDGLRVSQDIIFIAASNRVGDKSGVNGLIEPLKNRFDSIIELEMDFLSWKEWAIQNNINSMINKPRVIQLGA